MLFPASYTVIMSVDIHHMISVLLQLFRQAEVNDPQVVVVLHIGEHDVEWLEVEVENSPAVYEVNTSNNLKIKIRVGIKSGTQGSDRNS